MCFEFVFMCKRTSSPKVLQRAVDAFRAFDMSRVYRELRVRSHLVTAQEPIMLDREMVLDKCDG